jgi:hypothetical protein
MSPRGRPPRLAVATLTLLACATFRPMAGPVQDVVPRIGHRDALVTDTAGREFRLNTVHLQGDTLVGISIDDASAVKLMPGQIREIRVLTGDPITTFATSNGVMLILVGAAVLAALIAHAAAR